MKKDIKRLASRPREIQHGSYAGSGVRPVWISGNCWSRLAVMLLFVLSLSIPGDGFGDDTFCSGVKPINGDLGYKHRGSRCEGFFESDVSADTLQIVSLLQGTIPSDWGRNIVLEISAPGSIREPVNVRAVPLTARPYYRMDGVLRSDVPMDWPVGEVLFPSGIKQSNLGIFGWIGPENDRTFIPLRVSKHGAQPLTGENILIVRSGVNIDKVVWRSAALQGEQCGGYTNPGPARGPFAADAPIRIPLGNLAPNSCVDIQANKSGTTERLRLTLKVRVP
jgi:hypothetical protein